MFPDRTALRTVLGHYPSGVTIVTAMSADQPVGFSCQSFHSLSLDPPMIIVLPGRTSTTWPLIRSAGRFCVNVLSTAQEEICRNFSVSGADKFAGVDWRTNGNGSPALLGASAWIDCTLAAEHDGGDHTIAVGNVVSVESDEAADPLVFHRGLFRALAV